MRIVYLEHHPAEGIGSIGAWAQARGHHETHVRWYAGETPPPLEEIDLLVVMGGPMGIHDVTEHPWLFQEKAFLDQAISFNTPVLGICLGAQLLADRLGATVSRNAHEEIGWHEVLFTPAAMTDPVFSRLPNPLRPFHWHGDTFGLPAGATRMASSAACTEQAFVHGGIRIGLQFHLEFTRAAVQALVDITPSFDGPFVQKPEELLAEDAPFAALAQENFRFLDAFQERIAARPPTTPAVPPPAPVMPSLHKNALPPPSSAEKTGMSTNGSDKKVTAGILGIILGSFGVHKFVLGYNNEGVIMLLVTLVGGVVTCGAATGVMGVIGLIEGIIYLTKSDEDFVNTYVNNKRGWF